MSHNIFEGAIGASVTEFTDDHVAVTVATVSVTILAVATGDVAPPPAAIAAAVGATGALGAASTGTDIKSLSGIALANAALAAIGGGARSAGGGGVAAGTQVISSSSQSQSLASLKRAGFQRTG